MLPQLQRLGNRKLSNPGQAVQVERMQNTQKWHNESHNSLHYPALAFASWSQKVMQDCPRSGKFGSTGWVVDCIVECMSNSPDWVQFSQVCWNLLGSGQLFLLSGEPAMCRHWKHLMNFTIQYNTIQYNTTQYNNIPMWQYSIVQCSHYSLSQRPRFWLIAPAPAKPAYLPQK